MIRRAYITCSRLECAILGPRTLTNATRPPPIFRPLRFWQLSPFFLVKSKIAPKIGTANTSGSMRLQRVGQPRQLVCWFEIHVHRGYDSIVYWLMVGYAR